MKISDFNSHAHVERDLTFEFSITLLSNFNSHAHVERDRQEMKKLYMNFHFNSHAHVERDKMIVKNVATLKISTHTLTWSVTLYMNLQEVVI